MTKTTEGLPAVTMDGPWPLWCTLQHQMLVVTHIKTHTLLLVIRSRHAPSCSYMVLHFPVKSASQHHPYREWRLSERLWRTLAASCPPPVFPFFCLLPLALAAAAVAGCPLTSGPQRASSVSVSPSLSATSKDLIPGCDTSPTLSQPVPTITFK